MPVANLHKTDTKDKRIITSKLLSECLATTSTSKITSEETRDEIETLKELASLLLIAVEFLRKSGHKWVKNKLTVYKFR